MVKYDYLIVGGGLYGATFAYCAHKNGKRCLVIDKRSHVGGNIYCEQVEGINVHKYGAHIFHTDDRRIWNFVNSFVDFNRYTNSPLANYQGRMYNLPFNMNTFYQMWGVVSPQEANSTIEEQKAEVISEMQAEGINAPVIWRNKLCYWLEKIYMKGLSKAIRKSNGEGSVWSCLLLL